MQLIENFKKIKNFKSDKLTHLYILFACLRILLVFIPQFGYIHPDEFFQSVEVVAGDVYDLEHIRTWEFNETSPIRSMVMPYLLIRLPFSILTLISYYSFIYLNINLYTSYILLIYPRFVMCLLSFLNDWSLYQICRSYELKYQVYLLALSTSFVMLVFGSRTFSNTIEMTICSVLLSIVAECMVHSNTVIYQTEFLQSKYQTAESITDKVKYFKLKSRLPGHSFNNCFWISTLCVLAIFNRPTFFLFGMPIIFFWLLRGLGTSIITIWHFNLRVVTFLLSGLPALAICIFIDSLYYGFLTLYDLSNLDISINSFIVTPYNFIRYNIKAENTGKHGVHPKYLHLLVNIPLLYNILGIIAICSFGTMVLRFCRADYKNLPRAQSIVSLMTASIFIPLLVLSLINHQEPRFLLPLTLPIILLHTPKFTRGFTAVNPFPWQNKLTNYLYNTILRPSISKRWIIRCWFICNCLLTIIFGFIHQGGVLQMIQYFSESRIQLIRHNINYHIVTSHIYSTPMSLFYLPNSKKIFKDPDTGQKYRRNQNINLYEYGDKNFDFLFRKIKLILDVNELKSVSNKEKYHLYVVIPTSLEYDFLNRIPINNTLINYKHIKTFYPHLSTEAFPKLLSINHHQLSLSNIIQSPIVFIRYVFSELIEFLKQFGLNVYKIEVIRKRNQ